MGPPTAEDLIKMERLANELRYSGWLTRGDHSGGISLILRFRNFPEPLKSAEALLIAESPQAIEVIRADGDDGRDCLVSLLKKVHKESKITIRHRVTVYERIVDLCEEIRLYKPDCDDIEYRYCLSPDTGGYWSNWDLFTQSALLEVSGGKHFFRCCANCALSALPNYGGADDRNGLYCFRDNENQLESLAVEADRTVWREVAHPDVSALHVCERHIQRTEPI